MGNKMNIPSKYLKALDDFDDILDLLSDEESSPQGMIAEDRLVDNFELYNFLECEQKRLSALNKLFTEKADIIKNHSQTLALVHLQQGKLAMLRENLKQKLQGLEYPLQKQLSKIWDDAYSQ